MSAVTRVLVTGGTGNTGRRISTRLRELGLQVRSASRAADPDLTAHEHVRFDWHDEASHAAALAGVSRMYLVAPALDDDPSQVMLPFITRALAAGVRRIVLLSASAISDDAPGLGTVAREIRRSAPEWAVLRPSWFMQNFLDRPHMRGEEMMRRGELVTSTGDGRVPFVDVGDIAEVGARALADARSHDSEHVITGPEALSYADVAEIVTRITGRPVRHVHVDDTEATARMVASGIPERYAQLLVGLDRAIRGGAEDRVTDTVERVTGRAPRSFAAFVQAELTR